jgi:hypothetical protein
LKDAVFVGSTTEASASGLTETQLIQKDQWSSTAAMAHYLHDDDEAEQDAQMKMYQASREASQAGEEKVNICQNKKARLFRMETA